MKPFSWDLPALDWPAIEQIAANKNVSIDSRTIQAGEIFLAFDENQTNRRAHIIAAIAAGAAGIIWEEKNFQWEREWQVPNLAIPNLRAQAGILAAHLYGYPSHHIYTIGITGTNGKTSIAHWLAQAFNALGQKSVLMGTVGNGFLGQLTPTSLTTSDAATIQKLLAQYRQQGATHLAMEISSHALAQGRAHGVEFDVAVFTNLSRDHLDYHGTMQQYGQAKAQLFEWESLQAAVINADDAFSLPLLKRLRAPTLLRYGIQHGDVRAINITTSLTDVSAEVFTPWGKTMLTGQVIGRFNIYNLLASLSTLLVSGVSLADASRVLADIQPAVGRMQKLGGGTLPLVIIDYAHTPDALEKALSTLRETMPKASKLYCVFGCGGGRDQGKRPLMAEVVTTFADMTIITSDNPRQEDPQQIINDMVAALHPGCAFITEIDRAKAIAYAIRQANPQDVVLIAGKGHETYQDIGGLRHLFNDAEIAERELAERRQT